MKAGLERLPEGALPAEDAKWFADLFTGNRFPVVPVHVVQPNGGHLGRPAIVPVSGRSFSVRVLDAIPDRIHFYRVPANRYLGWETVRSEKEWKRLHCLFPDVYPSAFDAAVMFSSDLPCMRAFADPAVAAGAPIATLSVTSAPTALPCPAPTAVSCPSVVVPGPRPATTDAGCEAAAGTQLPGATVAAAAATGVVDTLGTDVSCRGALVCLCMGRTLRRCPNRIWRSQCCALRINSCGRRLQARPGVKE